MNYGPPKGGHYWNVVILIVASACAMNPATGRRQFSLMSEAQEVAIGRDMDAEVRREMGLYADRDLEQYVSSIGQTLAQNSERGNLAWHFAVVDMPVINAFALPGGYIYLTRGILPFLDDEAQLAGVLGHEIGHVTARHAAQQYSRATGAQLGLIVGSIFVPAARPFGDLAASGLGLLFLKYGRGDELEADALGVRYAARSGWNPEGVAGMLRTLDRIEAGSEGKGVPNWLSTHPAPADRVERVRDAIERAAVPVTPRLTADRNDYLRRIDGIIYGDNPEQGVVRGRRFLHAGLRFALDFPQSWNIDNSPSQVVAKRPNANVFILMQLVERPVGRDIEAIALNTMNQAGLQPTEGRRTTINGLDAFVATYQGTLEDLGRVAVHAAHIVHGKNIFMVAGIAPIDLFGAADRDFMASIDSFQPITAAQAEAIHPNRIDLYTARAGDTWPSIAERAGEGTIKPATLAIMNGHSAGDQPRAGERLKIVVGG
jgi:predicted Zn-dependent protease